MREIYYSPLEKRYHVQIGDDVLWFDTEQEAIEAVVAFEDAARSQPYIDHIAALIEAGDRLNELACHQDDCQIVTHGVWSDPIPCTCGYTEAWKQWKEVRGE